jgi:subtilisin family serine protease
VSDEAIQKHHSKAGAVTVRNLGLIRAEKIRIPSGMTVEEAVAQYRANPDVEWAEPNYIRRAFVTTPNDASFGLQWGLHNTGQVLTGTDDGAGSVLVGVSDADMDMPEAWDTETGAASVIIAVIDSGIDYDHPDLAANIWANTGEIDGNGVDDDGNGFVDDVRGWDFANNDNDPIDDFGHGTHVSGIIGAVGNNGTGISGVMWDVQLMPIKMINVNGEGTVDQEVEAISYAITNGARIINASLGAPGFSNAEYNAIAAASSANVLVTAAAGNESSDNDDELTAVYPASYDLPNVISVAASDFNGRLAFFSNFGNKSVHVAAPGDCIYSTLPDPPNPSTFALMSNSAFSFNFCTGNTHQSEYDYLLGTSMAAPQVAGLAGLLLAQDATLSAQELRTIIMGTTVTHSSLEKKATTSGVVNGDRALRRDYTSPFTGGSGGGGGCGMIDPGDWGGSSWGPILSFLLLFGVPIWWLGIRRLRPKSVGLLILSALLLGDLIGATIGEARHRFDHSPPMGRFDRRDRTSFDEKEPAFGFPAIHLKLGYHLYPNSEYFDTWEGSFEKQDFASWQGEIEYDHPFFRDDHFTVRFSTGYYDGTAAAEDFDSDIQFDTYYLLITPTFHEQTRSGRFIGHAGAGIGYYYFQRDVTGIVDDTLTEGIYGFHLGLGTEWSVTPRWGILLEWRWTFATIASADVLDNELDIGGHSFLMGVSYRLKEAGRSAAEAPQD